MSSVEMGPSRDGESARPLIARELQTVRLTADNTLEDALQCLDKSGLGIALVLDSTDHLVATLTDGDLRRAILAGVERQAPIAAWAQRVRVGSTSIAASADASGSALIAMMRKEVVRHIPLLNADGRVVGVACLTDLIANEDAAPRARAVVMAGGRGTRMHPLTLTVPKPMLVVGDRPLIQRLVEQLHSAGVTRVSVSTHYLAEQIIGHLGTGEHLGVNIDYLQEDSPRGTAGALALLDGGDEPIIVINGDILTTVDFEAMMEFHNDHGAALTVAVRSLDITVPYGVVSLNGAVVTGIAEKPTYSYFANAGIYVLDSKARRLIPRERRFDMTDLIEHLCKVGERVVAFPVHEYWRDIGLPEDYARVQNELDLARDAT